MFLKAKRYVYCRVKYDNSNSHPEKRVPVFFFFPVIQMKIPEKKKNSKATGHNTAHQYQITIQFKYGIYKNINEQTRQKINTGDPYDHLS
jgi:hypothetical protein